MSLNGICVSAVKKKHLSFLYLCNGKQTTEIFNFHEHVFYH